MRGGGCGRRSVMEETDRRTFGSWQGLWDAEGQRPCHEAYLGENPGVHRERGPMQQLHVSPQMRQEGILSEGETAEAAGR